VWIPNKKSISIEQKNRQKDGRFAKIVRDKGQIVMDNVMDFVNILSSITISRII